MNVRKLNNISITPLVESTQDPSKVVGGNMFADPFSNIVTIARKKSGKSTVIYHILKNICRKGTIVFLFAPSVHKDETYKHITEMLEKKGCIVSKHIHFIEDGVNLVEQLLDTLSTPSETCVEDVKSRDVTPELCKFDSPQPEVRREVSARKSKKIANEYVCVFDDLASDLRHRSISQLMVKNRHYKIRNIMACQYLTNLDNISRKQIDYCLIFKSIGLEKLETLYESLDLNCSFDDFVKLYLFATEDPFSFMFIDVRDNKFRKNFNMEVTL